MSLRLFDTATREERPFVPLTPGEVGMYVCGPTVQSAPHVGHLRAAVAFDVLQRWLERSGYHVTMVRNVTDIGGAFREMWRVARPGCVLACLEVARPRSALLRLGHRLYFERVVPLLARVLGADSTAYRYLPQSARAFPPPDALARIMQEAGWEQVQKARAAAGAAYGAAREEAERQGLSLEGGKAAAESLVGTVREKAERVAEAATEAAKAEVERQDPDQSVRHDAQRESQGQNRGEGRGASGNVEGGAPESRSDRRQNVQP